MQRTKQRQKQEQQHKPYVKVESLICWVYYGLTTPTPVLHGKFSDFEKCTKRRYDYHSCIIGFLRGSQSVLNYIITCFQSLVGLIQISSLVSPRWSPGAVSLMTCCLSKPGIHGLNPGRIHSNEGVKTAYPFWTFYATSHLFALLNPHCHAVQSTSEHLKPQSVSEKLSLSCTHVLFF